jgi:putative Ca2+/H+ antiporter (TMEM165/GDT1 family)
LTWHGAAELLLITYSTVLASELIGDKSILTISSLAARLRPGAAACGVAVAFMIKMSVAVLSGHLLAGLPVRWTKGLSAATLLLAAAFIWRAERQPRPASGDRGTPWRSAVLVAFSAIFFSEWGDPGQIAAAALAASSGAPGLVWLGGAFALCTKGALAMTLGVSVRRRIPDRAARAASCACCLVLGLISLWGAMPPR